VVNYTKKNFPDKKYSNYVKALQEIPTPLILAKDAKNINESESNERTIKSTVILCVALRNQKGYIKKFAFHNGTGLMPPTMRNKAEKLGYHVIKAEYSHAEGQFLQFLYQRHISEASSYSHIIGMGCSRLHCVECNCILSVTLGLDYDEITAAVQDSEQTSLRKRSIKLVDVGKNIFVIKKYTTNPYELVIKKLAIDNIDTCPPYKQCKIPKSLAEFIQLRLPYQIKVIGSKYKPNKNTGKERQQEIDQSIETGL
jgi:hypothetical protein